MISSYWRPFGNTSNNMASCCLLILAMFIPMALVHAVPSQYCNFRAGQKEPGANDFCMAVSARQNQSTQLHDLYITMEVYRPQDSALGWTAIGIGPGMAQSLDFIVYGDPKSLPNPVLSVRSSNGHWEPEIFDDATVDAGKLRVGLMQGGWHAYSSPLNAEALGTVARVSLVCYSYDSGLDPELASPISLSAPPYQSWIWAKSDDQQFSDYSARASLTMHSWKRGYGHFLVNMTGALVSDETPASTMPTIRPGIPALGAASDLEEAHLAPARPRNPSSSMIMALSHGFLASLATVLILPGGIFFIVSGPPGAAAHHWQLDLLAMACLFLASILALFLPRPSTAHQIIGSAALLTVTVLAVYGKSVRHQSRPAAVHQAAHRPWTRRIHVSLGGLALVAGYGAVLTGMAVHEASTFQYVVVCVIIFAQIGWLSFSTLQGAGGKPNIGAGDSKRGQHQGYELLT
ncbi:hypothetical protein V2A60_010348 [Cordyceps javanica]|uniref:Cellobiose dehydrogenase n=1 Tax=Cordyceps javanica TaxID=43265 RepID=A0A545UUS2_9HYPO|nr:hypothetical protein IF1G_07795 [Cordyceps javanica]TQW05421.1 hypothetical protein IF2G_07358 [Cordyceps javanica]